MAVVFPFALPVVHAITCLCLCLQVVRVKMPSKKLVIKEEGLAKVVDGNLPQGITVHPCDACGKAFTSEETLNLHKAICQVNSLMLYILVPCLFQRKNWSQENVPPKIHCVSILINMQESSLISSASLGFVSWTRFYPRPVLVFGYYRCLRLSVCVCVSVRASITSLSMR